MPTDGPTDPRPDGPSAAAAEGSIFDRLRSPVSTSGEPRGDLADGTPAPDAGEEAALVASEARVDTPPSTPAVDSSRLAAGPVQASHDAAGLQPTGAGSGGVAVAEAPVRIEDLDARRAKAAERNVALLFTLSAVSTISFVVTFIYGGEHQRYYTPALGGTIAAALFFLGAGAVVWAKRLMPDEEAVQEREPFASPEGEVVAAQEIWRKGVAESGFVTRPLVRRSLLGAASALGLLAIVPLRALAKETMPQAAGELARTSWRKGLKLIDTSTGQPVKLGTLAVGGLVTVIPEGTEKDEQAQADSVAMLIRLRPDELQPVKGHEGLDFQGHVVYSKLCSHLGCPVSLYEQQTHRLLCPCHQSQFLANESARPIFGPASRRLAQLAITVDPDGYFIARDGDFPEPVGPGYWERT